MRNIVLGFSLVLTAFACSIYPASAAEFGVSAGTCQQDSEISAAQRASLENTAMTFVQAELRSDGSTVISMLTNDAQKSVTPNKLAGLFDMLQKTAAPFGAPHVAHTYFIRNVGVGSSDTRMICGDLKGNAWASVEIKPGTDQSYVLVTAKTRNNDWMFTEWLLPDGKNWRVGYFNANASTIVGMTPDLLLEKARKERDTGHTFNASLLYVGALGISSYGPGFQLGIAQHAQDDLGKLHLPPEISGKPPFTWTMQGKKFTVQQVSMIGVAGQLGIVFVLPQTAWPSDAAADSSNRQFINAFIATHPDYSRSFSFLLARAMKPDNSGGMGTVYQNGKGFDN